LKIKDKKGANNDIDTMENKTYKTLKNIVIVNLKVKGRRRRNSFL